MLSNAILNAKTDSKQRQSNTLQLWPSLGLLEFGLWRRHPTRTAAVIFHDPTPIRRQFGFDAVSKFLARNSGGQRSPRVIVHSDEAFEVAEHLLPKFQIQKVLHPTLGPRKNEYRKTNEVVVAGQYKPERDLRLLAALGPKLKAAGMQPRIYGRGWPDPIPGWAVTNRYIPETELDAVLARAAVVLVPYRTYFQSNVAVRALELGTPSILKASSFSRDLFDNDPRLDIGDASCTNTVMNGLLSAAEMHDDMPRMLSEYQLRVDNSWRSFMGSL